ncbi:hypothetical protein HB364_14370 [Pseudoflavitalea sp. X16]|uniref:hypothetical protein n=1 Tax=Paraflavitalea devenefica TaxID=2716334 RepID=UPI001420DA21|nr:hypothetical protein [Paraflavitalea devenefica]NII26273.1 hypothetical protein [Paraflavitalea devenefica]
MKKLTLCLIVMTLMTCLQAQDLALAGPFGSIMQPVTGCSLTTENVTIRIFNFGSTRPAGSSFPVNYILNGGMPVNETITLGSALLTNSSLTYTFTTRVNLSIPGTYIITATVSLPGDINPDNNSYTNLVTHNAISGGTVNGSTSACASGNSGTLTLASHTGNILRWEYSNDNGNTWYYISNTTTTQSYSNLKTTTLYRAAIQYPTCGIVFSSIATITINC